MPMGPSGGCWEEARPLASVGMTATAGRGSFKHPPKTYEEMHPGAYDAKARLKYMDEMGIWAMVMYPERRRVRGAAVPETE